MADLRPVSRSLSARRRRRYRLRAEEPVRSNAVSRLRGAHEVGASRGAVVVLPSGRSISAFAGRRFLIVSAPFGPFGAVLAGVLEERGATVERMIFNAGDALNWRRGGARVFKDTAEVWAEGLKDFVAGYTDLILFGEGGPYNRAVLSAVETIAPRVWVMENGYFRPDWVTVERNGVNGSSALPRRAEGYPDPAPITMDPEPVGRILPHHVTNITAYHLFQGLGGLLFPHHANPYTATPLSQCLGHVRRYLGLTFRSRGESDVETIAARGDFFIACLQREGDAQLLRYSRYADNTAFLVALMSSFTRHAPAGARLLVKNHPLDPGLLYLRGVTRRLAVEHGLEGRVDFIDGGNLAQLCRASRGMVVNNSSAALSALGFHTPVKVMGAAFFDFDGLTDQQSVDDFWNAPQAPDPKLFARFRAHVIARSQINGNFHEPRAIGRTAKGIAALFERVGD